MSDDGKDEGMGDVFAAPGIMINGIDPPASGNDGDEGRPFPLSDADDFCHGARFIPGEVTLARRKGEKVVFVRDCSCKCCWYWQMPDGSRIYHFEGGAFEKLKSEFDGRCPKCGNTHISGGMITLDQINAEKPPKSGHYKPGYDSQAIDDHPNSFTPAGDTVQNLLRQEEGAQRMVAENPKWLIAKTINSSQDLSKGKDTLEDLGFKVIGENDDLFLEVIPPDGWTKETSGYWTTIKDANGKERGNQFFKGAVYDRRAHITIK